VSVSPAALALPRSIWARTIAAKGEDVVLSKWKPEIIEPALALKAEPLLSLEKLLFEPERISSAWVPFCAVCDALSEASVVVELGEDVLLATAVIAPEPENLLAKRW